MPATPRIPLPRSKWKTPVSIRSLAVCPTWSIWNRWKVASLWHDWYRDLLAPPSVKDQFACFLSPWLLVLVTSTASTELRLLFFGFTSDNADEVEKSSCLLFNFSAIHLPDRLRRLGKKGFLDCREKKLSFFPPLIKSDGETRRSFTSLFWRRAERLLAFFSQKGRLVAKVRKGGPSLFSKYFTPPSVGVSVVGSMRNEIGSPIVNARRIKWCIVWNTSYRHKWLHQHQPTLYRLWFFICKKKETIVIESCPPERARRTGVLACNNEFFSNRLWIDLISWMLWITFCFISRGFMLWSSPSFTCNPFFNSLFFFSKWKKPFYRLLLLSLVPHLHRREGEK